MKKVKGVEMEFKKENRSFRLKILNGALTCCFATRFGASTKSFQKLIEGGLPACKI
jgi:hypothetical protein